MLSDEREIYTCLVQSGIRQEATRCSEEHHRTHHHYLPKRLLRNYPPNRKKSCNALIDIIVEIYCRSGREAKLPKCSSTSCPTYIGAPPSVIGSSEVLKEEGRDCRPTVPLYAIEELRSGPYRSRENNTYSFNPHPA